MVIGAIGAVIQHFILFLKDEGYSASMSSRFFTALLVASIGGRVLVGYLADRFRKKDVMALFYGILSVSVLLLNFAHYPAVIWAFVAVFGFSMGADYMLIPLVAAECFGTVSLGKLLALIIMGYSLGQWRGALARWQNFRYSSQLRVGMEYHRRCRFAGRRCNICGITQFCKDISLAHLA